MQTPDTTTFVLEHFEGTLDLLWHLIHRNEIDIYEVPLQQIAHQCWLKLDALTIPTNLEAGADFVGWLAALILYKSKILLPKHEQQQILEEVETADPHFEVIHHLLDYCRFKQAAKKLTEREQTQSAFYTRGVESAVESKKHLGVDHLSLDDLANLFQQLLSRTAARKGTVEEETWKVSDKIKSIRQLLIATPSFLFVSLFNSEKSRDELIVTFLALLELMKMGEARVVRDQTTLEILIWKGYG